MWKTFKSKIKSLKMHSSLVKVWKFIAISDKILILFSCNRIMTIMDY